MKKQLKEILEKAESEGMTKTQLNELASKFTQMWHPSKKRVNKTKKKSVRLMQKKSRLANKGTGKGQPTHRHRRKGKR